jgi:hypothetical protein
MNSRRLLFLLAVFCCYGAARIAKKLGFLRLSQRLRCYFTVFISGISGVLRFGVPEVKQFFFGELLDLRRSVAELGEHRVIAGAELRGDADTRRSLREMPGRAVHLQPVKGASLD